MRQAYQEFNFTAKSRSLISMMNEILENYRKQGFTLTVRQLFYQMVSKDIIPNTLQSYKSLASLINDGRLAGLIDWSSIEDRTRDIEKNANWLSPSEILQSAASSFHMDMWEGQENRVVIIVEKEALVGVLQRARDEFDLHLLAARGYPSVTVLRDVALHVLHPAARHGQHVTILHFGDHDPSGIDMTRDLRDRIDQFNAGVCSWELKRVALNFDQVEEYNPPPNPAKSSDTRFKAYQDEHGDSSWELDALEPAVLLQIVSDEVRPLIDQDLWARRNDEITDHKARIQKVADDFKRDFG